MSFLNLPAELRAIPKWCVWRKRERLNANGEIEFVKPPFRLDNHLRAATWDDPTGWGTFDHAVALYQRHVGDLDGIGFMLTESDPFVVVDLDDIRRVAPANMERRQQWQDAVLRLGTYTEASPSGNGAHAWMIGELPVFARAMKHLALEVYAARRFMTCTGNVIVNAPVLDCQWLLDQAGVTKIDAEVSLDDDPRKPLSQTDNEIYVRACGYVSWWADRFHGREGGGPGDWSHTFMSVVGVLEALTGSVSQIARIMRWAPMVTDCPPSGSGESRVHKCERTLLDVVKRVRGGNNASRYFIDHGRQVWENIERHREKVLAEMALAQESEMARLLAEADENGGLSKTVLDVLGRFKLLTEEHRKLTPPPGIVGDFVRAAAAASRMPFIPYAIPATLATLAGIVARSYCTERGGGLNMNYVLMAPTATGKTQSMKVWKNFMLAACADLPLMVQPKTRILSEGASSIQGMMAELQDTPSCVWYIEEAAKQLNAMADPKGQADENLLGAYQQFYDKGDVNETYDAPRSVAAQNAGIKRIERLCVSTYWSTTPEMFELSDRTVANGFVARVVFIRYTGQGGARVRGAPPPLPENLRLMLRDLLSVANENEMLFKSNPAAARAQIRPVDTSALEDLVWEFETTCDSVVADVNAKVAKLPKSYVAFSRLPQGAMRIASLLAVIENPWAPVVTPAQYKWAFGYLLQNMGNLLSSMDTGEMGDAASDEQLAVDRVFKDLVRKGEMKGLPGLPRSRLHAAMRSQAPFRTAREGRSQAATKAMDNLIREGYLVEVPGNAPAGRGRPVTYLQLGSAT